MKGKPKIKPKSKKEGYSLEDKDFLLIRELRDLNENLTILARSIKQAAAEIR